MVDGEEKGRELVLVDCHEYCFYPVVFFQTPGLYQCVVRCVTIYGVLGIDRVEAKSKKTDSLITAGLAFTNSLHLIYFNLLALRFFPGNDGQTYL